jgi:hypothetical protein
MSLKEKLESMPESKKYYIKEESNGVFFFYIRGTFCQCGPFYSLNSTFRCIIKDIESERKGHDAKIVWTGK